MSATLSLPIIYGSWYWPASDVCPGSADSLHTQLNLRGCSSRPYAAAGLLNVYDVKQRPNKDPNRGLSLNIPEYIPFMYVPFLYAGRPALGLRG